MDEFLMGRKLLKKEIPTMYHRELDKEGVIKMPGMTIDRNKVLCHRCGLQTLKRNVQIKNRLDCFYYCPECLILGRVESRLSFFSVKEKRKKRREIDYDWQGELTKAQEKIANELISSFKKKKNHIVHAVTGAGKTEMLFPLLHYTLSRGCRVAIASPRIDVCLELFPRLQAVFKNEKIVLLYGKQDEPYAYSAFVIATTHQLLRFYEAFDLIVVDEVDAFPFLNNQMLENGVRNALKKKGCLIYLTATPSKSLTREITKKSLKASYLPKRYHGYQLPVPDCVFDFFLIKTLQKNKLPPCLLVLLKKQNRQCLLFFSNIERMKIAYRLLIKEFPQKRIAFVYAGKSDRKELILAMRRGEIDWLMTTTILERGVTFPNIDVIIFEADHQVFNTASLVQISGRVGRKKEFPTGHVYFLHKGKTKAINQAIHQIKEMNRKAGF